MKNRSVIELMVLAFTAVVALVILGGGVTIAIIEIQDPTVDTSAPAQAILSITVAILGALLGLIAGRADFGSTRRKVERRMDDEDDE